MSLVKKCRRAEQKMAEERGGFILFGLFEREETPGRWDVLVSAPWVREGRETLEYVARSLDAYLSSADWLEIARIVPLSPSDDFVRTVVRSFNTEGGVAESTGGIFNGIRVSHAFIITAQSRVLGADQQLTAA